jgi:C4-dicarboxylate transporter DctM subunit
MTPELIILMSVLALLALLALELPIALALASSGTLGIYLLSGTRAMNGALGGLPFSSTNSYSLAVIPLFIFMGAIAVHGRIAEQVFSVARYHLRKLPGGLGVATVAGCAGFAAVTGSSIATAAIFARMSVGEMVKHGYSKSFASGIVAAAGTLGALIPPSVLLVFYGIISGESIGKLLIAGIIPGVLGAVIYAAYVTFTARKFDRPSDADLASTLEWITTRNGKKRPVLPYRGIVRVVALFVIVVGGIYSGFVTSNEAAGLGALISLIFLVLELRKEGPTVIWNCVKSGLHEAATTTGMIFFIIVGASIFSYMLVLSGLPQQFTAWATTLPVPSWVIIALILAFCIPLGMALDSFSIMAIVVPLSYPIVVGLGFDGVWYGVLIVKMCELGLITPPVGVGAFVVAGATKDIPLETVFRGIVPFIFLELLVVLLVFVMPSLATWLPNLMVN